MERDTRERRTNTLAEDKPRYVVSTPRVRHIQIDYIDELGGNAQLTVPIYLVYHYKDKDFHIPHVSALVESNDGKLRYVSLEELYGQFHQVRVFLREMNSLCRVSMGMRAIFPPLSEVARRSMNRTTGE